MATNHFADRIIDSPNQPNSTPRNVRDVAEGTVLVGQIRKVFDTRTQTELIIDVELLSAEWMFQFSIDNEGDGQREHKASTDVGMVVSSGSEVSNSVSASAGFSGWGFSAEVNASTEWKTFNTLETSNKSSIEDMYTCPPGSSIYVYKRKYNFRCRTWFFDGKQNAWIESVKGKMESSFVNEIIANQELISPVALANHGKITNNPPAGLARPQRSVMIPNMGDLASMALYASIIQTYMWANR